MWALNPCLQLINIRLTIAVRCIRYNICMLKFASYLVARTPPPFSNFLFTNLFSIKILYFFIISSLFPYFNLFVSIFIQSYVNIKLHVSTLYRLHVLLVSIQGRHMQFDVDIRFEVLCVYRTYIYIIFGAVVVVIIWQLDLQLHVQSMFITTKVVSSNPTHGEVHSIQHYVIKFVSDLRQDGCFIRVKHHNPNTYIIFHPDITQRY